MREYAVLEIEGNGSYTIKNHKGDFLVVGVCPDALFHAFRVAEILTLVSKLKWEYVTHVTPNIFIVAKNI